MLASCSGSGIETESLLNPRLALHRHGEEGSLHYAASHFRAIYGTPDLKALAPIYPVLGTPAFTSPGGLLRVDYLGPCATGEATLPGVHLALVGDTRSRLSTTEQPLDRRLVGYDRSDAAAICRFSFTVRVANDVGPGLYALEHRTVDGALSRQPGAVAVSLAPPTESRPFKFIHLSDLHQRHEASGEADRAAQLARQLKLQSSPDTPLPNMRVLRIVELINSLRPRPDFAVLTGDIVDHGDEDAHWRASRDALARLEVPVVALIGNHDYYRMHGPLMKGKDADIADPELSHSDLGLQNFMRHLHPWLAPRFEYAGYGFLGLDTGVSTTLAEVKEFKLITTAGVSRGQLADVRQWLARPTDHGHVLLGHTPTRTSAFGGTTTGLRGRSGTFQYGADKLEELLVVSAQRSSARVVYLNGHIHWNHLFAWEHGAQRFSRIDPPRLARGQTPCWRELPPAPGPLLISTQSATKSHPLYAGWLRTGYRKGEGPGDGFGFRLLSVRGSVWHSASYRMDDRDDKLGAIDPRASDVEALPMCARR